MPARTAQSGKADAKIARVAAADILADRLEAAVAGLRERRRRACFPSRGLSASAVAGLEPSAQDAVILSELGLTMCCIIAYFVTVL
jgi:hypothetical protein